jgi:tetraacyldisaccharide 4'-kinase
MPGKILNRLFGLWVNDNPPLFFKIVSVLLLPLSYLNNIIQSTRVSLYHCGLLKSQRLEAEVISIGNLSMGGSGKTPTAAFVAEILLEKGRKPAILSRGYGGKRSMDSSLVVSDRGKILTTWELAGDEPFLLAKNLKGVPVIVGKDRFSSGRIALDRFQCDTLILDDGYQHLRLKRERNLCLIDCSARDIFEDRLFPSGRLREPLAQLKRADAFLLTHWEETSRNKKLAERLETGYRKNIFRANHVPGSWLDTGTGKELALEEAKGKKILAFCGIANPSSFFKCLEAMGSGPTSFLPYPDHYCYSQTDLRSIESKGQRLGADLIATTEKDWIRLEGRVGFSKSLWVLRVKINVLEDSSFRSFLSPTEKI